MPNKPAVGNHQIFTTARLVGFHDIRKGVATLTDSGSAVKLENGLELKSRVKIGGSVHACVRPERVKLNTTNGFNNLEGRVVYVFRERFGFRIIIDITALSLQLLLKANPLREML
jgi:hypothetical protein